MMRALGYQDESLQMPPNSAGGRLTDAQIDLVRQWIARGAPDLRDGTAHRLSGLTPEARAHWSFQPVVKPALPEVRDRAWCLTPVDFFVLAKLEANGLRPSPPADPEALLRRMYYDMLGLPPTLEEINAFSHYYEMALRTEDYAIAEGKVPYGEGAKGFYPARWLVLEKWIDQLLASPHYGERWGRHWLDTARYAETAGTNNQNPKNRFRGARYEYAWTYRDYVIDALNHDKPYNQFVVEQLAADKLPDLKPQDERLEQTPPRPAPGQPRVEPERRSIGPEAAVDGDRAQRLEREPRAADRPLSGIDGGLEPEEHIGAVALHEVARRAARRQPMRAQPALQPGERYPSAYRAAQRLFASSQCQFPPADNQHPHSLPTEMGHRLPHRTRLRPIHLPS